MNRNEYIKKVARTLRENKATKSVSIPRRTFTISDDTGKSTDFVVKTSSRDVLYNTEDVEKIVDCCMLVLLDALKHGESISFHGIGSLGLKYRVPKMVKDMQNNGWIEVPGHYSPKFSAGTELRAAAKVYELSLDEGASTLPPPIYDEYEEEED